MPHVPLTDKVKLLIPAIACCVVAALFFVGLVGADAQRSPNAEFGDAEPMEVVQPANEEAPLSISAVGREAYEAAVTAMVDAASRVGYRLVQSDCRLACTGKRACPGPTDRHVAPVTPLPRSRLGTGDHQLCEGGECWEHLHTDCFRGSDLTSKLFEAIENRDWEGLEARIAGTDDMTYNRERRAIQGLDCMGDHLALHLPAPSEFVEFMDR